MSQVLKTRLILLVLVGITAVLAWLLPAGTGQQIAAALLSWGWPVLTWFLIQKGSTGQRFLTAAGLALLLNALLALLIHYLPGPIPSWALIAASLLVALFPLLWPMTITWNASIPPLVGGVRAWRWWALLLLLTVALRLPNLAYKEFQGDEGIIMLRAAAALQGDDVEIFLHQKGPIEILLPLLVWGETGAITEFWARLPFFWASVLTVMAVALLAYRWFGREAALAAGFLLAVNGFGIAFGRIIQYQSLVMLWGLLALLHADRYRQAGQASDLLLAAVFLAGGLLAHYDAILVVPAVAWLLGQRIVLMRRLEWLAWGKALLAGAAILAVFYVPFFLNPNFARTGRYLLGARLGAGGPGLPFNWSGPAVWQMSVFYNSFYYVAGLIMLLFIGLGWLRQATGQRTAALLYFSVPLLFYTLVVADPRTHVYTIFPGAIILAGVGWMALLSQDRGGIRGPLFASLFTVLLLISAVYIYLLFIETTPERQRTWSENRPSLYPAVGSAPPAYGLFGFPYQAGWRAVANLPLIGPYASNEEMEITAYYLAQAPRTHCPNFATFILAENVQDVVPYDPAWLAGLHLHYRITVNGRPTLAVYSQQPAPFVSSIEASRQHLWRTPAAVAPPSYRGAHLVGLTLGQQARLLGYDLDTREAYAGGQVTVTLYWQALAPFDNNYQVFTHLYDGQMWGQHDGAPECALNPTTRWEPGQIIADPHIIPVEPGAPAGPVPLLVGMYDLLSKERLAVPGTADNVIHLADVWLRQK